MKCSSCGHINLTDFPFCEQCLAMLPVHSASGAFDLGSDFMASPEQAGRARWPPFPWNPRDLEDQLIGRERTVKELLAGFEEVLTTWTARIHLLVSEYGMGKSRVASSLVAAVLEREPDTLVVRVRCPTAGGPFRMWDALLRETFEIPAGADPAQAGARLVMGAEQFLPDQALEVAAPIAYLTGYDVPGRPEPGPGVDDEALIGRGTAATARLLAAVSIQRPILMVVDHANRASARSLALAGALEATLKGRPVMMVLSGAPELTEILPGWDRFPCSRLKPLSRSDADKMLRLYLVGLDSVPKELIRRVLDQSFGNPYAIKAMVRYLRSAGAIRISRGNWEVDEGVAWDLEMPDNLEGVILAQIGRLTASERATLARAAVVGRVFWLGSIIALDRLAAEALDEPGALVSDDAPERLRTDLERLVELRFIQPRESAFVGEEAFGFRSDEHWRVASTILPATTKERFHRIVWQWLVLNAGWEPDEHLAALALHAEGAGEPGEAARYLLRAARRAKREHQRVDERRFLEAADALVAANDLATRLSISFDLGDVLRAAGDWESALAHYQAVLHLAWRMRHRGKGAAALARIGVTERDRGRKDRAYGHLLQALRLFESVGDRAGVAEVCNHLGMLFRLRGDFEKALRFLRKAEQIYRRLRNRRGLATCVHDTGALHFDRGNIVLAGEYLEDALDLRRRLDDREGVARTSSSLGVVRFASGDHDAAVAALSEAAGLAKGLVHLELQATIADNLGEALMAVGRIDDAREQLEHAIGWAREGDLTRILVDALRNRAHIHLAADEVEQAARLLAEARREAERLGSVHMSAMVERSRGDLEHARGGDAASAYRVAAAAFEAGGYALDAALTREQLVSVLEAAGETEDAEAERIAADALRARHRTTTAGRGA